MSMMPRPNEKFVLSDNTPESSKTTINIGGFHVFLYGIDELTPRQAKDTTVIFHIHGRTRTHQDAEDIFRHVLHELRQRGGTKKGVVGVTFDNRNHGLRAIDDIAIHDWKGGNLKHAQDMLSMMDGIVADMQNVMKFLESYVDGLFVPTAYIATGLSLGGHVTWDILAEDPRIQIAIIIIGSPNLTSMLVNRLAQYKSVSDVPKNTDLWPKSIEKLYLERDEKVKRIAGKKILILNGAVDDLVPSKFTIPWMENFSANNDVMFMEQEEAGHALSYEMMQRIVDWLPQWLN